MRGILRMSSSSVRLREVSLLLWLLRLLLLYVLLRLLACCCNITHDRDSTPGRRLRSAWL
jgi:hypothetical protein